MPVRLILWGALFTSTFIYLLILQVAAPAPATPPDPIVALTLAFTSVVVAVVSYLLPATILRRSLLSLDLPTDEAPMFGDVPAGTRIFRDPDAARARALPAMQTAMILALALRESIALFGLLVGFIGFPMRTYAGFFVVSWLLLLEAFPRKKADDAALEAAYGAKLR